MHIWLVESCIVFFFLFVFFFTILHQVSDLVYLTDNTYKVEQVFTMERIVLRKFGFDLNTTDPVSTMEHFLQIAGANRMVNTCNSHSSSKSWFLFFHMNNQMINCKYTLMFYASTYQILRKGILFCKCGLVSQNTNCWPSDASCRESVTKFHTFVNDQNWMNFIAFSGQ